MELMWGSLDSLLDLVGPLEEKVTRGIFKKVVKAVEHCHKEGFIHHDLKTSNILIDLDRKNLTKIKLSDFGMHRQVSERLYAGSDSNGTVSYCAPEVLKLGHSFNKGIDCWSLGIVLHELLFNNNPFKDRESDYNTVKNIINEPLDLAASYYSATVSFECQDLLDQLLQKKAGLRLSASEILAHPWFHQPKECGSDKN